MPALNELAASCRGDGTTYGDALHVVHVFIAEPHPAGEPSPYTGELWEVECSLYGQPTTYAERVATAKVVTPAIGDGQIQLVDDLDEDGLVNPVWCTYGPAPNPAFLIGQDGVVVESQQWADMDSMKGVADSVLPG